MCVICVEFGFPAYYRLWREKCYQDNITEEDVKVLRKTFKRNVSESENPWKHVGTIVVNIRVLLKLNCLSVRLINFLCNDLIYVQYYVYDYIRLLYRQIRVCLCLRQFPYFVCSYS